MKNKAANNKGLKEPLSRKSKKPDRKYNLCGKEKVEDKKQRRPIQKNRFTNIEELQNPTGNMPFELFGSLVFSFAKETSDVQISDSTGDYELRVSNETLKEFKLKVLLGVDQRSKPKFTILLGDCQCYPELPEGPLVMKRGGVELDDECVNKYSEEKVGVTEERHPVEPQLADGENEVVQCTETMPGQDTAEPLGEPVKTDDTEDPGNILRCKSENYCPVPQPEHGDGPCSEDELTMQSRKSARKKNVDKLGKHRSRENKKDAQNVRMRSSKIQDGASTYLNNLEGFIQFLINDEMCYSALKKTRAPLNLTKVARRIVSGRNMIKYSDGREFIITFEEKDTTTKLRKVKSQDENESSDCPPNSFKSESECSLSTLKELLSASDDKSGKKLEEEFRTREELTEAKAFVENVKKELIEWQARCEEAIDFTIVTGEKNVMSKETPNKNIKIEVSDVLNALQKVEDVYEDATSNSSNLAQADSLEHFFLDLDEYDKMTVSKETKDTVKHQNPDVKGLAPSDVLNHGKPNATSEKRDGSDFKHRYIPPIPLNITSPADIELMWMSFVKQLYSGDERLKTITPDPNDGTFQRLHKSDLHLEKYHQHFPDVGGTSNSTTNLDNLNGLTRQKSFDNNVYPGQHCYPYFVEANLKRVNSVMSSFQVSSSHKSLVNQPEHDFTLFGYPEIQAGASHPKYHFPFGVRVLNPGKVDPQRDRRAIYPLQRNANTLPQERCPNRRNRIFFNSNVSAGDWY